MSAKAMCGRYALIVVRVGARSVARSRYDTGGNGDVRAVAILKWNHNR